MESPQATQYGPPGEPAPDAGMPRWPKVFLLAVLATVMVIVMLVVGGEHGPGRHAAGPVASAEPYPDDTTQLGYGLAPIPFS